jgi:hypothetical protein
MKTQTDKHSEYIRLLERYQDVYEQGILSAIEIAKLCGCIPQVIKELNWNKELAKQNRRERRRKYNAEKIERYLQENINITPTAQDIARKTNTHPSFVREYIQQQPCNKKNLQNVITPLRLIKKITRKDFNLHFPNTVVYGKIKICGVPYIVASMNQSYVTLHRRIYENEVDPEAEQEMIQSSMKKKMHKKYIRAQPDATAIKKELLAVKAQLELQQEVYKNLQ